MGRRYRGHHLTEEQQKLVEDTINLAWFYISKLLNKQMIQKCEVDEVKSHILWHLCMAAESYNKETGIKFSTYVWKAFQSGYFRYIELKEGIYSRFSVLDFKKIKSSYRYEPGTFVEWEELVDMMEEASLSDREINILTDYYQSEIVFSKIAEKLGYSRERIRQIHWEAINKLKKIAENKYFEDFVHKFA